MTTYKVDQKDVDRFFELKKIGYINLKNKEEKEEYSRLKGLIMQHQPDLLTQKAEEKTEEQVEQDPLCGLTKEENNELLELNKKAELTSSEKRVREGLRQKKREYKTKVMKEKFGKTNLEEIKIGDPMKELAWLMSFVSRALAPQIFKDISAAGISEEELELFHRKAKLLNQQVNG